MSVPESQVPATDAKTNDKEHNFALLRNQLERERQEKQAYQEEIERLRKMAQENARPPQQDDDDDDDEPYIDKKRLKKEAARVKSEAIKESQNYVQEAVSQALKEERKQMWLKNNPDFYDVMQHAQKFAEKDPELAETILAMPEGFERQKLVYKNIKALGIHKPPEEKPSIQSKIDQNRKSPYYQPGGVGSAPYNAVGDFSQGGQKTAYEKMKELQSRLRI
jgi:hypothetical protein